MKAGRPLCLVGGRVVCPASGLDHPANVMVADRVIVGVGDAPPPADAEVIDCAGLVVAPGLVDAGVFRADARGPAQRRRTGLYYRAGWTRRG